MKQSPWNCVRRIDELCVVIPAYNEALLIGRCIQSVIDAGVRAQDIFVVDDMSSDDTAAIVRSFDGVNLLSNKEKLGKLGGLRHAVGRFHLESRYRYLSLLDADSHVAPGYFIAVLGEFLHASDCVLVCGTPRSEQYNWLTAYRALEYASSAVSYRAGQHRLGVITVAPGCASTYRTDILEQLDWTGGTLVEDMELTVQIHRKGLGTIAYTPDAIAHTQDPRTIGEYIGQLTRWYSGTWQVFRLHRVPVGRQRIDAEFALLVGEGLFYAVGLMLLPLLIWFWPATMLRLFLFDQLLWLLMATFCAVTLRRIDVLTNLPAFVLVRAINCVILLQTFWFEVIRNQRRTQWFSVSRYQHASNS